MKLIVFKYVIIWSLAKIGEEIIAVQSCFIRKSMTNIGVTIVILLLCSVFELIEDDTRVYFRPKKRIPMFPL